VAASGDPECRVLDDLKPPQVVLGGIGGPDGGSIGKDRPNQSLIGDGDGLLLLPPGCARESLQVTGGVEPPHLKIYNCSNSSKNNFNSLRTSFECPRHLVLIKIRDRNALGL